MMREKKSIAEEVSTDALDHFEHHGIWRRRGEAMG